jgi:signal transduction histidine kinase
MIGLSLSSFLPEPEPLYDPGADIVKEVLRGNPVTGLELQMKRRDDRLIWVNLSSRALISGQQRPDEIGITAFDITSRKNFEEKLREESERANLYMEVMSSDLNMTNQNVLFAMEDLSISLDLPERLKGVLSETSWSVRKAGRMIANMGVLISLNHDPPEKVLTRLQPHFNKAVREATRDFEWKTLDIKSNIEDLAIDVIGHAFLWYVFFNIIHYSASADPSSKVSIEMKAELTEDGDMVRIEFRDRAPAPPDDLKDEIFRRTGVAKGQFAGKGLSLTVVDRFVEDLGGRVWVENRVKSNPAKGTKYVMLIPAWKDQLKVPPIVFYKSEHCVFCGPVYESLTLILRELGIGQSSIQLVNVDDSDSEVKEEDLPALPTIHLGGERLSGFVAEDDLRVAISTMLLTCG